MENIEKMSKNEELKFNAMNKQTRTEVLDLTHEQNCSFKINFDDNNWLVYLESLKPIGIYQNSF